MPSYCLAPGVTSVNVQENPDETPILSVQGALSFCQGESVNIISSASNGYTWSNGETTQSISFNTNALTPDTLARTLEILDVVSGDILFSISYSVVISRGNVNFYPLGDLDDSETAIIDTSICVDDYFYGQANCPECKGNLTYTWQQGTTTLGFPNPSESVTVNNGDNYQVYTSPQIDAAWVGSPAFSILLTVEHGDIVNGSSVCSENLYRIVEISDIPTIDITYSSDLGNVTTPLPNPSIIPLCHIWHIG